MPHRIFISVDLPAPFSPPSAWISPRAISRSMSDSAFTPGKLFVMWLSLSIASIGFSVRRAPAVPPPFASHRTSFTS